MKFLFLKGIFILIFFISKNGYGQIDGTYIHESRLYGAKLKLVLKKDSTYFYDANVFWAPEKNRQDSGIWNIKNSLIILNSFHKNPNSLFDNTELKISKGKKRTLKNLYLKESKKKKYLNEEFIYILKSLSFIINNR